AGTVGMDAKRIRQVLLNVLTNALSVSPPGSVVSLDSTLVDGLWRVGPVDQGPGLAPAPCGRRLARAPRPCAPGAVPRWRGPGVLAFPGSSGRRKRGRIGATSRAVGRGLRVVIETPAAPAAA